ncbi:MAG TPA: D-aminoacyl-tRNA deacylase [Bacteroidia bacterium]|nr:D-aminoacyl-tRNA deacylase [Bacteroidia bacterium]
MRIVIQRVSEAGVTIEEKLFSSIGKGLLILVGIEEADTLEDIEWLCKKITELRIFADTEGKMNLSIKDVKGEALVVSQFTLHASTKKGNRPSYIKAARPDVAIPLYEKFIAQLSVALESPVKTGVFGAYMYIGLVNDGPVTILVDSKNRE